MGGGGGGCPWKITSCHLFPRRKNWFENWFEIPSRSDPPPPLELSGSAHACPSVEFYFLFVAGLAIIELTDCADAQVDLRLCCLHATAKRYT